MGMTDRQFDSYQARLLELLQVAYDEVIVSGGSSKELEKLIKKLDAELKRP